MKHRICAPTIWILLFINAVMLTAPSLSGQTSKLRSSGLGYVSYNQGRLYYEISGKGCPIVLIGGGGGMDSRQWDDQVKFLKKHYQTIRFDPRATGHSDTPVTPYSNVADLKALLDFLGIEKATMIGLSLGGGIALEFAITHPERVTGLVVSGALVRGFQISDELKKRVDKFSQASQLGVEEGVKVFLDDPYFVPSPDNPKARIRARQLMVESARTFDPNLVQQLNPPTVTRIAEIQKPTLLLIGSLDHPDLHRRTDFLEKTIAGSKKVVIKGAGHLINLEKPTEFTKATHDFLQALNCSEKQPKQR